MEEAPDQAGSSDPRWWRRTYYKSFPANEKKLIMDFDSPESGYWLRQEPAAWLYEIVRACPETTQEYPQLPGYDNWPSFPELHFIHQAAVALVIDKAVGYRPLAIPPRPRGAPPKPGYSEPMPEYSWDLLADDQPFVDAVMAWRDQQRAKFGLVRKTGKKGAASSHNRRELPKRLDWRWVEVLAHKKGDGQPLSETQRGWRRDARRYADRFRDLVISAFQASEAEVLNVAKATLDAFPGFCADLNADELDPKKLLAAGDELFTNLSDYLPLGVLRGMR